jgi:hypothetical protein
LTPTTRSQSATLTSPRRPGLDHARAVDQHVDARAGAAHGFDSSLDVEEIGRQVRPRLRARRRHRIHRHDLEAVVRQALDARSPDAPGAPGDDCDGHAAPSWKIALA